MDSKELVDKITLAAEQLESLRTEHDLPVTLQIGNEWIRFTTSNKKHCLDTFVHSTIPNFYSRAVDGKVYFYNTYEELVEDIK